MLTGSKIVVNFNKIVFFGCLAWIEDGVGEVGLENKEREQTNIPTPALAVNINNGIFYILLGVMILLVPN